MPEGQDPNPIPRIERRYSPVVYQRMRHILMSYRNLWSGTSSTNYEWLDLAADIEQATNVLIESNSLQNFVRGWNEDINKKKRQAQAKKKKAGKKDGAASQEVIPDTPHYIHKFSIPEDQKIEAIVDFLTIKENKGYFCDRSDLLSEIDSQAPLFFQEYLHSGKYIGVYLNQDQLAASYECIIERDMGKNYTKDYLLTLKFLAPLGNNALHIQIIEKEMDRSIDYAHQNSPKETKTILCSGWSVTSPENNLFIHVKEKGGLDNAGYFSLGLDNKIYQGEFPDFLLLQKHTIPHDNFSQIDKQNADEVLSQVTESITENILVLHKSKK